VWSRVRYEPQHRTAAGLVEATWTGSEPTCHGALSDAGHPCRPAPAAPEKAPAPVVPEPTPVAHEVEQELVREPSLVV
jgi:hypothetical protein